MPARSRILIVDDEATNRQLLSGMVELLDHEVEVACDGYEALAKLQLDFDLIILDVQMPGIDGYAVTRAVREDPTFGDVPILIATGLIDRQQRLNAVQAGANDFVTKPIDVTELQVRVNSLLKMKHAQDANKRHQRELEETVQQRTSALRRALEESAQHQRRAYEAFVAAIDLLARLSEFHDEDTGAHLKRMSRYCALLARAVNLLPGQIETIRLASPLHDVGKVGIPDSILLKPGKFTPEEMEMMKEHTIIGERILSIAAPISELIAMGKTIAVSHHERWDGTGYPYGVADEKIPLEGRICAVADVFDALTSERPYKKAFSNEQAFAIIREGRGKHFDPKMVDAFLANVDGIVEIQQSEARSK